jgi:pyruvate kinase
VIVACSYKKLPEDVKKGSQILCADGSIVLEVISTDVKAGTVRARCLNNAVLGWAFTHQLALLSSSLRTPILHSIMAKWMNVDAP